jgi:hypothetical protein
VEVKEQRSLVYHRLKEYQQRMKDIFDNKARPRNLQEGYMVLLWDKRHEDP